MPVVVNNSDSSGGGAAVDGDITIDAVVAELQQTNESVKNIADVISKDTIKANLILPFIDAFTSVFASSMAAVSTPSAGGGDIAAAKAANLQEWFFLGVISNLESINLKLTDILSNLSSSKGGASAAGGKGGGGGGIGGIIAGIGQGIGALGEGLTKLGNPKAALGAAILVAAGAGGVFLIGKAIQEGGWENISLATAGTVALAIAGIGFGLGVAAKGVKSFGAAAGVALAFLAMCPALLWLGPAIMEGGWDSIPLVAIASASAAVIGLGLGIAIASKGIKGVSQGLGLAAAFIAMGPALALMGLGLKIGGWDSISLEAILKGAAAIVAFGGALWLMSKILSPATAIKGALSIAAMSAGLFVFGLAMGIVNNVVSQMTVETMIKLGVLLVGVGALFALAGMLIVPIALGTAAFALMGLGLCIFGLGIIPIATITSTLTTEDTLNLLLLIGGLGAAFALAGTLIIPITLGTAAFAILSGGLALFGMALGVCDWEKILTPTMVKYVPDRIHKFLSNLSKAFGLRDILRLGKLLLVVPIMLAVGGGLEAMGKGLQAINKAKFNDKEANKIRQCLFSMVAFCNDFGKNENIDKIKRFAQALALFGIDAIQGVKNISTLTEDELSNINYDGIKILFTKLLDIFVGENTGSARDTLETLNWETQKLAEQKIIEGAFKMLPTMMNSIKQLNAFGKPNLVNKEAIARGLERIKECTQMVMSLGTVVASETSTYTATGGWKQKVMGNTERKVNKEYKSQVEMAAVALKPFVDFADSISKGSIDTMKMFANAISLYANRDVLDGLESLTKFGRYYNRSALDNLKEFLDAFKGAPNISINANIAFTARQEIEVSLENEFRTGLLDSMNSLRESMKQNIESQNRILQEIVVASREQKIATSVPTIIEIDDLLKV